MKSSKVPQPDAATIAAQEEAKRRAEAERQRAEESAASTALLRGSGALGRRSLFSAGETGFSKTLG